MFPATPPTAFLGKTRIAAAYVRMSTEHQQYSTSNQLDAIKEYALIRNMEIDRVYSDDGKSGLSIAGRESLTTMIADVESGIANFSCILVYDVSRWGRFQDADESAYYEFVCKRRGITVHYCAEQFENDGSPVSTIVKGVKRAMAGEYSRELSAKVFQGACRLIQLGYKQGGTAGYGLRRMLIDQGGQPKTLLAVGEHKSIQTDRVILVPGPEGEVAEVRWMFASFVTGGLTESEIADALNAKGIRTDLGRGWTRNTVHQVLTSEKYIGNNVYHRTSFKLKRRHVKNSPEQWVRAEAVWTAIVDHDLFRAAQEIMMRRAAQFTDEDLLEKLKGVLDKHGRISGFLIDEIPDSPTSSLYRSRFGSLIRAYSLIGYTPAIDYRFIEENRQIRQLHPEIMASVIAQLEEGGTTVTRLTGNDRLRIDDDLLVSVVLCRHTTTPLGASRWLVRLDYGIRPDLTIAVRLEIGNRLPRDFYVFPSLDITSDRLRMGDANRIELDGYRFDTLEYFFRILERIKIKNMS